ncbi:MAG: anaerobic ribonucleoside-triphosphate reductase, partial [Nitrospirota bacterium]
KGDISKGTVYYTNSTYIPVSAPVGPISRVRTEGLFHPMIEAGSLTHIWLGEAEPSAESVASFVEKVFRNTLNDQVALSPEFTACDGCGRTTRGLYETCPSCGSEEVDGITRITGYFTKVSSWNKGKLGELHDRFRNEPFLRKEEQIPETVLAGE